jgi:hypothetical protein
LALALQILMMMKTKTLSFQWFTTLLTVKYLVIAVIFTSTLAQGGERKSKLKEKVGHHLYLYGTNSPLSELTLYQDSIGHLKELEKSSVFSEDKGLAEDALISALKKYEVSLP